MLGLASFLITQLQQDIGISKTFLDYFVKNSGVSIIINVVLYIYCIKRTLKLTKKKK